MRSATRGRPCSGSSSSLRRALGDGAPADERENWQVWQRWVSEIVADLWSVARVGVTSTLGLISVVSLPRFFVFRIDLRDPHPAPWLRVKLSCALGDTIYPHPQWASLARLWEDCYPLAGLDASTRETFDSLAHDPARREGPLLTPAELTARRSTRGSAGQSRARP